MGGLQIGQNVVRGTFGTPFLAEGGVWPLTIYI